MASEGASQEGIDPKIVAALVNRFIADSASFLQDFAQQCEVKLLTLNQRLQRLERLIALFEKKTECLEPAESVVRSAPAKSSAPSQSAPDMNASTSPNAGVETSRADVAEDLPDVPDEEPATAEPAPPDPKYSKYIMMKKVGLQALQIRHKFDQDRMEDTSLDPSVLDEILGEDTTPIRPSRPTPKPKAAVPKADVPKVADVDTGPQSTSLDEPPQTDPASQPEVAPQAEPGGMMAEIARKQRERAQRMEAGAPNAVSTPAKKTAGAPTLFKSPSKAASSPVKAAPSVVEPQESAPPVKVPSVAKAVEAPQEAPIVPKATATPQEAPIEEAPIVPKSSVEPASQGTSLFKAPGMPPKLSSPPVAPADTPDVFPKVAKAPVTGPKTPGVPKAKPKGKASIQDRLKKRRENAGSDSDSDHSDF